jgi:hypothetical protein
MRSGWTSKAHYLLFDAGPYGGNHGHEDKLSIEICAHGIPCIVDSGSYTYDKNDPYRNYFVGSEGHNTVLVDQASQIRRWNREHMKLRPVAGDYATWLTAPNFDYVAAKYEDGYSQFRLVPPKDPRIIDDVTHTRRILFVKPDYWIVVDDLIATRPHEYQLIFHASPDIQVKINEYKRVCFESSTGLPLLYLLPVVPNSLELTLVAGSENPIQGWYSDGPYQKRPAQAVIYELKNHTSARMITIVCPSSAADGNGGEIEVSSLEVSRNEETALKLTHRKGSDYVLLSGERGAKSFGPYETTGIVAGVRTKPNGDVWDRFEA